MSIKSGKERESDKYFPTPMSDQFVILVNPNSSAKYGFNEEWLKIEKQHDTSPLGSNLMAIGVMSEELFAPYIKKVTAGAAKAVAKKMELNESNEFIESLDKSCELGGALAFLESEDLVTPIEMMHPSVWNAIIYGSFEDETKNESDIQKQARFCALMVGHGLVWEIFKNIPDAIESIAPVKY